MITSERLVSAEKANPGGRGSQIETTTMSPYEFASILRSFCQLRATLPS